MQHVRCQGGGGGGGGGGGQEPEVQTEDMCVDHVMHLLQVVFSDVASRGEEGRAYRQILLNRPRALNALNHSMAGLILAHLRTAASDPTVAMVIIEGRSVGVVWVWSHCTWCRGWGEGILCWRRHQGSD